jgi:hypothetical protein
VAESAPGPYCGWKDYIKNSNDTIGNRTRDLPTFSAVPQPTAAMGGIRMEYKSGASVESYDQGNTEAPGEKPVAASLCLQHPTWTGLGPNASKFARHGQTLTLVCPCAECVMLCYGAVGKRSVNLTGATRRKNQTMNKT